MKNIVSYVFVLIFFLGCEKKEVEVFDVVIRDANVINVLSGEIKKQTLYIRNDRIKKITSHNYLNFTSEFIIDATGKYVLPGFWDNHVHFRGGDSLIQANKATLQLFLMNGVTTVRDAGGDLTRNVMDWKNQIRQKTLVGPTIFSSGPKVDGQNSRWEGSLVVSHNDEINSVLDSLQKLRVDFVKLYDSSISGVLYLKTIAEASQRGLITSGHIPFTVQLDQTLDAGIGAIEHLYYILKGCSSREDSITEAIIKGDENFWSSMPKLLKTYEPLRAQNVFDKLVQADTYVVPTLRISEVLSQLDVDNHFDDVYLKVMPQELLKTYENRVLGFLESSENIKNDRKEIHDFFEVLIKSLSDAHVKILAGSDTGAYNSYIYPGVSLHQELDAMVQAGISNLEALQTSAYNGANFLKKTQDYGSVEAGKMSDLVILGSNPLNDIKSTRDIKYVLKGSDVYNPEIIAMQLGCSDCLGLK